MREVLIESILQIIHISNSKRMSDVQTAMLGFDNLMKKKMHHAKEIVLEMQKK